MPVPDFSPGEVLTAAAMDSIGLWLVKTQTVGAGVGSVTVTNAFSSDYQNYRVSWTGGTMSSATDLSFQLSGLTANGYFGSSYFDSYLGATTGINRFNNGSSWLRVGGGNTTSAILSMDIFRPAVAAQTTMTFSGFSGDLFTIFGSGVQTAATAATGLILTPVAGTISGGVVRVYGYRD
jgi:hypothetical protein